MKRLLTVVLAAALTVRAAPVEWEFPREGGCHEGLAFSDGVTGILVWGGGDTINLTVGRADLWDHRGGYPWLPSQSYTNIVALVQAGRKDELLGLFKKETPKGEPRNPYMLPLGRVEVKLQGGAELMRGELDPFTGFGKLFLSDGKVIELAMSKQSRLFAMRFAKGLGYSASTLPAFEAPRVKKELEPLGFKKPVCFTVPAHGGESGGFRWTLPADDSVALVWQKRTGQLCLNTGRGAKVVSDFRDFSRIAEESVGYWKAFWEKSARVKVPDPVVQRIFDYGMYRFGAMTDPDGVPAGLQGPWLEDDKLVPWNGDYHFNINVQECYSPAYRGGHFEHLMPLFRMVLGWRPLLRDNARKFAGIDDGYVLPHSVDDRGVCIGGFWTGTIDHGSTAWVASMMYRYVRYSGDAAFLRDGAYDFMKGAMNVYRAMMEEKDGKLSIPLGPSPEWGGKDVQSAVGRDPSFQLAAAHRLARDLVDAAGRLGEKPDAMWLDVERRLPQYVTGGCGIQLFAGQDLTESHRHHSHMAGLYPFNTVDFTDAKAQDDVYLTYINWCGKGCGHWSGWCVPWASILHTHIGNADAAEWMLQLWDRFFTNPGHGSRHDVYRPGISIMRSGTNWNAQGVCGDAAGEEIMQMDGMCAAVTAVMEMMVHEVNGKTEFFRGCPADWKDVSFENIRLSDGTAVSGRRINGKTEVWANDCPGDPCAKHVRTTDLRTLSPAPGI